MKLVEDNPVDATVDKKLKKFKSNKPLVKNYKNFIQELATADDPATLGDRKHGRYRNCIGKHLTKSHSVIYAIDYESIVVYLVDLDDHKNLYGRDDQN